MNWQRILRMLLFGRMLLLSLVCLSPVLVRGQTLSKQKALGRYQQFVWQEQHGLPQNGVLSVLRTRDGYLWLATLEGAARFDGVRFVVFDSDNTAAIKNNQILSLAEDHTGSLWLGMLGGGLARYSEGRFRHYTTQDGLANDFVRCLLTDRAGNLWIGTRGGGLSRFRDERFVNYTTRDGLPTERITALAEGPNGDLWVGTVQGLAHFAQGRFTVYSKRDGLPDETINALWVNGADDLWVGTESGLCRFQQGRCVAPANSGAAPVQMPVTSLYADQQHNFWIGTRGQGLYLLRDERFSQYTVRDGLPSDTVLTVYQDPEGALWIGTIDGGLCQFREARFSVYTTEDGLPHNFTSTVFEDSQGNLWFGTLGGLAQLKEGRITTYSKRDGLPNNDIIGIVEDRAGNLWINADSKLSQFRAGQFTTWTTAQGMPHDQVNELFTDRAGNLWLSTHGHGLMVFSNGRFRSFDTRDGLADNDVTAFCESRDGQLWLGTRNGGLNRFDPATQRFTTWTIKDGLSSNQIQSLYEDRAGSLWISSKGGLNRFKDGKFAVITVKDGLYDKNAFQILSDTEDDSGDLWMSCNRGIYRVSLRELNDFADGRLKAVTSFVYGVADGMISRECNGGSPAGWKTRDGRLWFATIKGVVVVDPRQRNTRPSLISIERVMLDRTPLPAGQPVRISPEQENLEIEYTGLNWNRPQQIRFKYQLAGFNQEWIEAGTRRTAYFSQLPPGNYLFKVIADNGDGAWNAASQSLAITVLPPFYRTWWFQSLVVLAVTGLLFAIFKYRIRQLEQRQTAQQNFARQLIESQEAERKRIAGELHDGLGQNLLVIKNRAAYGLLQPNDAPRAVAQLTDISTTAAQALDEVRQIAANLHPHQLDRLGLTKALAAMLRKGTDAAQLELTLSLDNLDDALNDTGQINFYRIVQEGLNNIIKHAAATQIQVQVQRTPHSLHLTMRDNGRGFVLAQRGARLADAKQPAAASGGLGLTGMTERARLLGGALQITTAPSQGTLLSLTIPLSPPNQER